MSVIQESFCQWLQQAQIGELSLTTDQRAVLQAAFHFRQSQGTDYYATRLLSHFLLHANTGLKVAQIARLLSISRPTASRQQGLSSREAVRQAHHRMDGRPYGKLLPRYAGPIAEFLFTHPTATRIDLLDFIDHTLGIRVSRVALGKFLKKFGLDETRRQQMTAPRVASTDRSPTTAPAEPAAVPVPPHPEPSLLIPPEPSLLIPPGPSLLIPPGQPVPTPAPPFSLHAPSMPGLSC